MKRITQEELNEILASHKEWVKDHSKGKKLNLKGKNLSHLTLEYMGFQGISFEEVDLSYANLRNCVFNNCRFDNARMAHANLEDCKFENSSLSGVFLNHSNLDFVHIINTYLNNVNVDNASMRYIDISHGLFDDTILVEGIGKLNRKVLYFYKKDRVIFFDFDGPLQEFKEFIEKCYKEEKEEFAICIEMFEKYRELAKNKK